MRCQEIRAELGVTRAWEAQMEEKLKAHGSCYLPQPSRRLHSGQPDHCQAVVGSKPGKGGFILPHVDGRKHIHKTGLGAAGCFGNESVLA